MPRSPKPPEVQMIGHVGKYHVRRLKKADGAESLDIREHVQTLDFEGYTRRGIVLEIPAQVEELRKLLDRIQ